MNGIGGLSFETTLIFEDTTAEGKHRNWCLKMRFDMPKQRFMPMVWLLCLSVALTVESLS